jgi:hypothetical protein
VLVALLTVRSCSNVASTSLPGGKPLHVVFWEHIRTPPRIWRDMSQRLRATWALKFCKFQWRRPMFSSAIDIHLAGPDQVLS